MKICSRCKEKKSRAEFFGPYSNGYTAACKPCHLKASRENEKKRWTQILERARQKYIENSERFRRASKRYREKNPELVLNATKAWREKNWDRIREYTTEYRKHHPDMMPHSNAKREAIKRGGTNREFTPEQWNQLKIIYGYKCAYCRKKLPLSRDHIIPVSSGGAHDVNNIVPACEGCNSRKNVGAPPQFQPILSGVI